LTSRKTPPRTGGVFLENGMMGSRIFPEVASS
jgi:hypothetical protein